ncbi:MAG TPA: hypothetical protein VMO78_12740 [Rhizomicrobium sp.]|nr:hypothetical protein [Rhizomicrobium sp.]
MDLVPRIFRVALVALALAGGSGAALADGTISGNGGLIALPAPLLPSDQDSLFPTVGSSSLGMPSQKFDLQNGHLDFFSVRPASSSADFTSLLGSGVGGGGLKLQFKW